jgi:hypothetical protein
MRIGARLEQIEPNPVNMRNREAASARVSTSAIGLLRIAARLQIEPNFVLCFLSIGQSD